MKASIPLALLAISLPLGLEGNEIRLRETKDVFASPLPTYLETPTEAELKEWSYILRYNEHRHAYTPLIIELKARPGETVVRIIRLNGNVDLDYEFSLSGDSEETSPPPEWALQLEPNDKTWGTDGISVCVEYHTAEQSRYIERWTPDYQEEERGLSEMNLFFKTLKEWSGISSRPYLGLEMRQNR